MREFPTNITSRAPDWDTKAMARLDDIIRYPRNHDPEAVEIARFARDLMVRLMSQESTVNRLLEMETKRQMRTAPGPYILPSGLDLEDVKQVDDER